jgi:hypothetical protein
MRCIWRAGTTIALMVATLLPVSLSGWILAGALMAFLFVAWLVTLFAILVDDMSIGEKLVWLLAVTLLAPLAIPVYAFTRHRRQMKKELSPRHAGY